MRRLCEDLANNTLSTPDPCAILTLVAGLGVACGAGAGGARPVGGSRRRGPVQKSAARLLHQAAPNSTMNLPKEQRSLIRLRLCPITLLLCLRAVSYTCRDNPGQTGKYGYPCKQMPYSLGQLLTVAVGPIILPLPRLKVLKLISPALAQGLSVPDFPAKFAGRIPIALLPNQSAKRIHSHRRMFPAGGGLAPDGFNRRCIEGLA